MFGQQNRALGYKTGCAASLRHKLVIRVAAVRQLRRPPPPLLPHIAYEALEQELLTTIRQLLTPLALCETQQHVRVVLVKLGVGNTRNHLRTI